MNTEELIQELQRQKEMLGNGFFDQELLEKYLDASYLKPYNEDEEQIELFGLNSVETLQTKLTRIYPYAIAKPKFNRMRGKWSTLYNITQNSNRVIIPITHTNNKQKLKTFKQDKAA